MARKRRKRSAFQRAKSAIKGLFTIFMLVLMVLIGFAYVRERPQDLPWTELALDQPVGMFTGRKLAALDGDYRKCQRLLDEVAVDYQPFPPAGTEQCRRNQNISLLGSGAGGINYNPRQLAPSCPVAATLKIWEDQVVQPAAINAFGQRVKTIRHLGSFSCRKIAGNSSWSEHATGNAIDIAAFELADGKAISLSGNWAGDGAEARFLWAVRNGSCGLFATVLSPDYNAAHADHFHLDQAARGIAGYRLCR